MAKNVALGAGWSAWTPLFGARAPAAQGVYVAQLVDGGGRPVSFTRLLGRDDAGIVTIGRSDSVSRRIEQMKSGIRRGRGHSAFNLLWILGEHGRRERVNGFAKRLRVRWLETRESSRLEERCLKSYFLAFGELPPLSSALPRRYDNWAEMVRTPFPIRAFAAAR
jgi:hypothetical protein